MNGVQNLGLFITNCVGPKRNRRLHRRKADELHDVVGDHIPECARLVVVTATLLDADGFGNGDLHVINVTAGPPPAHQTRSAAKSHKLRLASASLPQSPPAYLFRST